MKKNTLMGALHPVLFFAGVYIVALFFSIFICSAIFYSLQDEPAATSAGTEMPSSENITYSNTVASLP